MTLSAQIARLEQAAADIAAQIAQLKALQAAVQRAKGDR